MKLYQLTIHRNPEEEEEEEEVTVPRVDHMKPFEGMEGEHDDNTLK